MIVDSATGAVLKQGRRRGDARRRQGPVPAEPRRSAPSCTSVGAGGAIARDAELRPIVDLDALTVVKVLKYRRRSRDPPHPTRARDRRRASCCRRRCSRTSASTASRPTSGWSRCWRSPTRTAPTPVPSSASSWGWRSTCSSPRRSASRRCRSRSPGTRWACSRPGVVRTTPWLAPILGGIGGLFGGLVFLTAGAVVGQPGFLSFDSLRIVFIASIYDAAIATDRVPDGPAGGPSRRFPVGVAGAEGDARSGAASTRLGARGRRERGAMTEANSRRRLVVIGVIVSPCSPACSPVCGSCRSRGARSWRWPRSRTATGS